MILFPSRLSHSTKGWFTVTASWSSRWQAVSNVEALNVSRDNTLEAWIINVPKLPYLVQNNILLNFHYLKLCVYQEPVQHKFTDNIGTDLCLCLVNTSELYINFVTVNSITNLTKHN